jgi:hypothetical protein
VHHITGYANETILHPQILTIKSTLKEAITEAELNLTGATEDLANSAGIRVVYLAAGEDAMSYHFSRSGECYQIKHDLSERFDILNWTDDVPLYFDHSLEYYRISDHQLIEL